MAIDIVMPAISPTMVAGKLVRWHVAVGDKVRKGDLLVELETDKAAMDIEAPEDGVLEKIPVAADTADVAVETVIGVLGDGEAALAPAAKPVSEPAAAAADTASAAVEDEPPMRISPLARRLARELDVGVDGLVGTGPRGRIIAQDIREAAERAATQTAAAASQPPPPSQQSPRRRPSCRPGQGSNRTGPCAGPSPAAWSRPNRPCRTSI